jgi:hypothetical protein
MVQQCTGGDLSVNERCTDGGVKPPLQRRSSAKGAQAGVPVPPKTVHDDNALRHGRGRDFFELLADHVDVHSQRVDEGLKRQGQGEAGGAAFELV